MSVRRLTVKLLKYFFLISFVLVMLAAAYGVHRLNHDKGEVFLKEGKTQP